MKINYSSNLVVAFSMLPSYISIALLLSSLNIVLSLIVYVLALYVSDLIYNKVVLKKDAPEGGYNQAFTYWVFTLSQWSFWVIVAVLVYTLNQ